MRALLALPIGLLATALGAAAAAGFLGVLPDASLAGAFSLHLAAAALAVAAARVQGAAAGVDLDTVLIVSLFVPVVGPALAWTFPSRGSREDVINAHAAFESYERGIQADSETYRPAVFTGDFNRDLSRQINAVSYVDVLRQGTLDQKRNLLRTLGRRAEPRHLAMIRRCLHDDDHELRLCAYAEIDRLSREREGAIAELKVEAEQAADGKTGAARPLTELAEAQLAYARSGILDEEMAGFWLIEARKTAAAALALDADGWRAARIAAVCHAEVGEFAQAMARLDELSPAAGERPEIWLTRCEIAFRCRDFALARREARKLRSRRLQLPSWLQALGEQVTPDREELSWRT